MVLWVSSQQNAGDDRSPSSDRFGGMRLEKRVPCVLVVDDDPAIRDAVSSILRDERYIVASASNGREALELMRGGFKPSALLLDVWMPDLDGPATIDEMKADPSLATIPIVLITAADDHEIKTRARRADGVMKKPLDLYELLEVVDELVAPTRVW